MGETPYYTNSSHLPVGYTEDIFEALDIQDELQTLYTSGTVFHTFIGEKLPDWKAAAKIVRTIAENYKLPYYTISPTYSICKTHGYLSGEHFVCPECGNKAEVYSRITGYYRPVQHWNDGKTQEYKDRQEYDFTKSNIDKSRVVFMSNTNKEKEDKKEANENLSEDIKLYLFTTKTCPNCGFAREYLKDNKYTEIDAEDKPELSRKYSIMQAPTLVVVKGDKYTKYVGTSNIKIFTNNINQTT